jgi:hypothetical protein
MLQPRQTGAPGVRSSVKKQGDDLRQGGVNQSAPTKRKSAKRSRLAAASRSLMALVKAQVEKIQPRDENS